MSLKDRTVLITRRAEQAGDMIREIERLGGRPVLFPTVEITDAASWEEVDGAIGRIGGFDALVFASANAVERFLRRCRDRGVDLTEVQALRIYAVGETTRAAVTRLGLTVTLVPDAYSARGLAEALPPEAVRGKRFLIPRGDRAREELPRTLKEMGADVETVTVYSTVLPGGQGTEAVRQRILSGSINVITFASPSAVTNFVQLFSPAELSGLRKRVAIAVIGPTTEQAVRQAGLDVAIVAEVSTGVGLVRAIDEYSA